MEPEPCPEVIAAATVAAHHASNLAGWLALSFVVGLLVADLILYLTGRPTMSQWIKKQTAFLPWHKIFTIAIIGGVLWHLLEGGPL